MSLNRLQVSDIQIPLFIKLITKLQFLHEKVMLPTLLTNPKVVEQQCFKAINVNNDISHCDSTVDAKLSWVRSQIIGGIAEIHTPFGIRKLTYADHTATGRCLRYIEDYIIHTVLPFYGNVTYVYIFFYFYGLFIMINYVKRTFQMGLLSMSP